MPGVGPFLAALAAVLVGFVGDPLSAARRQHAASGGGRVAVGSHPLVLAEARAHALGAAWPLLELCRRLVRRR